MRDLRSELERLGERARPRPDAFERLERRRRRAERNRRIGAGAVALLLTVGGSVAAFSAFRSGDDEQTIVGVEVDTGFHALWPETRLEEALIVQAQVERGEQTWRSDPSAVATEFAESVLGWADPRLTEVGGFIVSPPRDVGSGVVAFDVQLPRAAAQVTVMLSELVPGVWSVVAVDGAALHTGLPVGAVVADRSALTFPVVAPEGTEVEVGFWYGPPGCASGQDALGVVRDQQVVVDVSLFGDGSCEEGLVPGLDAPADGLIWIAMMEPGSASALSLFSVEPGGNPEVGYVTDLAAVPVLFVPEGSKGAAVPDIATVTCDGASSSVDTPLVAAQSDGVHIDLVNAGDEPLSFTWHPAGSEGGPDDSVTAVIGETGADAVEPGTTATVWTFAPGSYIFVCLAPGTGEVTGMAPIEVVDPAGFYVPFELECAGEAYGSAPGYADGARGDEGDPLGIARARLTGLEEGDLVERAGYSESEAETVVRIVRGGVVVGRVLLFDDRRGDWLLSSVEGCGGTSFGWSTDPIAPSYPRGWFQWCPEGPFLEPGQDWSALASEAAILFAEAYVADDDVAVAQLLDASVPAGAEFVVVVAEGAEPTVGGTSPRGGGIVEYSCGGDVESYTAAVTIDDGSDSASADFTVFLILREDGWRVWGVY